jgi:hypothetical protein
MRRSNKLYLTVFKPQRFLHMHPFESDQVKTNWLIKVDSDHMNFMDCPSESSERAIICHTHPAAYWKDFYPKIC